MKKRLLSLLLAVLMVMTLVPMSALAWHSDTDVAYAVTGGNIYFDKETGEITDCDWGVTEANIPSEIDGVKVISIGYMAFGGASDNSRLLSVTIPNSIKSIKDRAFNACVGLTNIIVPNSVTSIGCSAFSYCISLKEIIIPDSVTYIGSSAFWGCRSLINITLPKSITCIGQSVFARCTNLESFHIDSNVTEVDSSAFYGCTSLTNISVSAKNLFFKSVNGALFSKDEKTLVVYPAGIANASYEVPNKVVNIGQFAFSYNTNIIDIIIPISVYKIESAAFEACDNLKYIFYEGTELQWNEIDKKVPTSVKVHFNANSHNYVATVKNPTCDAQGYTTYTCSVCGDSFKDNYVDENHAEIIIPPVAATCTTQGKTKGVVCSVCNAVIVEQEDIPVLDHTIKIVGDKPASCTEAGYTGDEVCTICGEKITQGETVEATGHHFNGNTCPDCGTTRSTIDTIRAFFQSSFNSFKIFLDKLFGR